MNQTATARIAELPCWNGDVKLDTLSGGMTNLNFKVTDGDDRYVVRLGDDDPVHLISRANEIASCQAAYEIGVSPELVYHEAGILVVRFVEGKVFDEADVRIDANLQRIVDLLQRFHRGIPARFKDVAVMFWVFQVLRHYQNLLLQGDSAHVALLPELARVAADLETAVGPVDIVFGHNDLLPANFIDDGDKIWLIDFDYAGFNSPLFDLSNLASNNELDAAQEHAMLQQYFGAAAHGNECVMPAGALELIAPFLDRLFDEFPVGGYPKTAPEPSLLASYHAMKCASLLRETMWSMVSELYSRVDMDFADYTQKNLARFEAVYAEFKNDYP